MGTEIISQQYVIIIITSIIIGTLARVLTLVVDYRQYPTYPNGYLIHLVTGFIASALGALAVPALMSKDFEAVTFLALAIEQFRDVRRMETESLNALEEVNNVSRGDAYIDGIAKTFEARNYFSLLVSLAAGITMELAPKKILFLNILYGIIAGTIVFLLLKHFSKGKTVGDIAEIKLGNISVQGSEVYVDDIFVTNHLGMENARELVQNNGLAAVVYPKEQRYRIILDHEGQRRAMLFEACRTLGIKRYHFTRRDYEKGRVAILLVPIIKDEGALIEAIRKTPLLESVRKNYKVIKTDFFKD